MKLVEHNEQPTSQSPLLEELQEKNEPFTLTFCSGKGGVGKSILTANLGAMLATEGYKVLVWDADIELPNLHLLFGVEPPVRSNDVIENKVPIEKALFEVRERLYVLSGRPDHKSQNDSSDDGILAIYEQLLINTDFDFILLDTPAGASETVLKCCNIADRTVFVVTDEPTSLVDAYVLVKLLLPYIDSRFIKMVVNNCIDDEDAEDITEKVNLATDKFLGTVFESLAMIPYDRIVRRSIVKQKLFTDGSDLPAESNIQDSMAMLRDKVLDMSGKHQRKL